MNSGSISQSDISAGRDNAGGDISHVNSHNSIAVSLNLGDEKSPIAAWMALLANEISTNKQIIDFIDTLQMYREKYSHDGISGLENKLKHAGKTDDDVNHALKKKELFTRMLAKYSMFESAQEIFAYLLSKLEHDFRTYVLPNLKDMAPAEIDQIFDQYLVAPCANEIKSGVFCLNSAIAAGMVYWLAEQCYIRWHA